MWEKEKLLVVSNFSFSHSVFKRLVLQTHKNQRLFGKGLNTKFTSRTNELASPIAQSVALRIWEQEVAG